MGLLTWIIFGALAGWVANRIVDANQRPGCLLNILVGVIGAFFGEIIMEMLTGRSFSIRFNLSSFAVAVIGAIILLVIVRIARRRRD